MMQSKKRKRDSDYPRITYHAEGRTFDRLFKEESLWETKEVVRHKLGLSPVAGIQLVQLRAGLSVDLEDDDDFDAFYALSRTTPALDIRVIITDDQTEGGRETPDRISPGQLLINEKQRDQSSFAESTPVQHFHLGDTSHSTPGSGSNKKRKVSFVDSSDIPQGSGQTKRRKSISKGVATSDPPNTLKLPPTIPSAGRSGDISDMIVLDSDSDNRMEDVSMSVGENSVYMEKTTSKGKRKKEGQQDVTGDSLLSRSRTYMPGTDFPLTPSDEEQCPPVKTPANSGPHLASAIPPHEVMTSSTHVGGSHVDSGTATKTKRLSNTDSFPENSIVQAGEVGTDLPTAKKKGSKRKGGKDQEKQAGVSPVTTPSALLPSNHPVVQAKGQQSGPAHPDSVGDDTVKESVGQKAWPDVHGDISKDTVEANASAAALTKKKKSMNTKAKTTTDDSRAAMTAALSRHDILVEAQFNFTAPESNVAHDEIEIESTDQPKRPKQSGKSRLKMSGDLEDIHKSLGNASKTATSKPTQAKRQKSNLVPCPVCRKAPLHLRYQCPVITAGPESIMKRLLELKENPSVYQMQLVEELEHMLKEGKMKKAKKSDLNAASSSISAPIMQQALSNMPPSDKRSVEPPAEPANSESSILPPTDLDHRLPSWKPAIPRGSRISDFTVDIPSEVGGSEDSNSYSESDEEGSHSSEVRKGPATVTPDLSSYTGIDLDAIIRGPPSLRPAGITNILVPETDEEEVEEAILEEEDDTRPRRISKKLRRVELSSDEEDLAGKFDDDDEDITSPPPVHVTEKSQAQSARTGDSSPSVGHTSFQAIDGSGESIETDRRGDIAFSDALAVDTAALRLAEGSEDDTRVAPSADDGNGTNELVEKALSTRQQECVTPEPVQSERDRARTSSTDGLRATSTIKSAPQQDVEIVEIVTDDIPAENGPTPQCQRSAAVTPSQTHDQHAQEDPIEPADDLVEEPKESNVKSADDRRRGRSQTPVRSTTKGGRLKRMMDKNGKALRTEADVPVLMNKAGAGNVAAETPVDQESGGPDHTKRARSTSRPPGRAATPGKRGRPAKTAEQKALEAAEKLKAKEEKERLKQEKARKKEEEKEAKARLRQARAESKGTHAKTSSLSVEPASVPAEEISLAVPRTPPQIEPRPLHPPPSLPQWAALSQSSSARDQDFSDQLQYSSPKRKKDAVAPGGITAKGKSRRDNFAEKGKEMQEKPLFVLTESQVPFPYSQWDDDAAPVDQPPSQGADEQPAASQSEDETTTKKPRQSRLMSASSYRKLTDIASQQGLFPEPSLAPAMQLVKHRNIFGNSDEDEDEEDEEEDTDGSESDSVEERSHIPLARRAGTNVISIS